MNEEWVCIVKAFRLLVKITVTEKQKEYIDTVCKQAVKKDTGKERTVGEEKHKERKLQSSFVVLLMFHAQKKVSVTQEKNPCILSFKNSFNLKASEFKRKDIDLQYILMCVYILKKIYLNQIL